MKINKGVLIFLLLIVLSVSTVGCSGKSSFNVDELFVFESVIEKSKDYKDPSSVRILGLEKLLGDSDFRAIQLQGENSFGANKNSYYFLYQYSNDEYRKGDFLELPSEFDVKIEFEDENIDIGKINKAIKKHWEDKGI